MPMADPMNGLRELQKALDKRRITVEAGRIHSNISVIFDRPAGKPRFTYAKVNDGKVQSIAVFGEAEPIDGISCFNAGYAVIESARGRGFATDIFRKGIDELTSGLKGAGFRKLYIEAVVGVSNEASNRLARKLVSDLPVQITDSYSGEPAFQYLKLIELQ